jgi:hypothetical protein
LIFAELIGVFLVGYGIWFSGEGVKRLMDNAKDWWRPTRGKRRYPYPVAGILLGVCFVLMGLVFALNNLWAGARSLVWAGVGMFVLVLIAGIAQPHFLHPRWYAKLEDKFGKKGVARLKREAFSMEDEEWQEVAATDATFERWADRIMPSLRQTSRAFQKKEEDE